MKSKDQIILEQVYSDIYKKNKTIKEGMQETHRVPFNESLDGDVTDVYAFFEIPATSFPPEVLEKYTKAYPEWNFGGGGDEYVLLEDVRYSVNLSDESDEYSYYNGPSLSVGRDVSTGGEVVQWQFSNETDENVFKANNPETQNAMDSMILDYVVKDLDSNKIREIVRSKQSDWSP
jgi:hypothetical protein